ncbi:GAF domain-containing protein [Nibribacter ruber]|uniref:GAF domain-containing protein n=1 Tax=Nibribacter ruber TaxID=2698458 RepID=A0A6P1NUG7_9BACT|nr:GAF domain-containing protein [Nibribacter ruber]QHL87496.1 GAF domain-containing protein [Nibribacter ruber]
MTTLLKNRKPSAPPQEQQRLQVLDQYDLLDTSSDEELDQLTELAALVCGTPIAVISLVASNRQWFKAKVGLTLTETPKSSSFCQHALQTPDLLEVTDARKDLRFVNNPLVVGEANIRFYAGAPLITPQGHVLGTLCVIDTVPRILTPDQRMGLEVLARQVMTHFELRRNRIARQEEQKQLYQFQCALQTLQEQVKESFQTPLTQAMQVLQHSEYHALKEKVKEGIAQFTQSGIALETKIESLLHSAVFGR